MVEEHMDVCLKSGIKYAGYNAEVELNQWEFQIGICNGGIEASDHLWMARYLLHRISEKYNLYVTFDPKPKINNFNQNGSGLHTNVSNTSIRQHGYPEISEVMKRFEASHLIHMKYYGDNSLRLTGKNETSNPNIFSFGYGNRSASVRIPSSVKVPGGNYYFEDRRPAANADPYLVTAVITKTLIS